MAMLGMAGGLEFDSKDNSRDVLWLGDCDHGCELLAEKLGLGVSFCGSSILVTQIHIGCPKSATNISEVSVDRKTKT